MSKICTNCKWYENNIFLPEGLKKCSNPNVGQVNPVSGKLDKQYCSIARSKAWQGECVDGGFFEEILSLTPTFDKIFGKIFKWRKN